MSSIIGKILHLGIYILVWFALYLAISGLYAGTGSGLMVVFTFLLCTGILLYIDLRRDTDGHQGPDQDR